MKYITAIKMNAQTVDNVVQRESNIDDMTKQDTSAKHNINRQEK